VKVMDAAGNTSEVRFKLSRSENMEVADPIAYQYVFPLDQDNSIENGEFSMFMPKGSLYENLKLKYHNTPDESTGVFSLVHHIHESTTPVHKFYEIGIVPQGIPDELRKKAVIARCGNKRPDNCGGTWKGTKLTTQVRSFGDYCVMLDQTPPTITPVVFDDDMRRKPALSFRISDNFSATDRADELSWRGTIDGNWVLFEYDSKRSRLTHTFDNHTGAGDHIVKLVVRDDRGNETVFEKGFKR
jgi:hypothetical protein